MSRWLQEYKEKLRTADEAVKCVKSGDWVEYDHFVTLPFDCDKALAKRVNELNDVKFKFSTLMFVPEVFKADQKSEHFVINDLSFSAITRNMKKEGDVFVAPLLYHESPQWIRTGLRSLDVLFLVGRPMDQNGFFNLSTTCSSIMDYIETHGNNPNFKVIMEVNNNIPFVHGENNVHITDVTYVVESTTNPPLRALPVIEGTEVDDKISDLIMKEMVDGACLQLGIGGMPNLVGKKIAESDLKDIGCHSEMFVDAYMDMFNTGVLTNKRKAVEWGKSVFTFAMGSEKLYKYMDNNPGLAAKKVSWVNNPYVLSQNDNVISICSCIEVDLFGNVSSESTGYKQISGTGGQFDYHFGSFKSKGGKGFVCTPSTTKDKDGNLISRIVPNFQIGTQITVPANVTNYVVTEFGVVNLKGLMTWERTESLIGIAHPQFRDELIARAEKGNIWRRSNKR